MGSWPTILSNEYRCCQSFNTFASERLESPFPYLHRPTVLLLLAYGKQKYESNLNSWNDYQHDRCVNSKPKSCFFFFFFINIFFLKRLLKTLFYKNIEAYEVGRFIQNIIYIELYLNSHFIKSFLLNNFASILIRKSLKEL